MSRSPVDRFHASVDELLVVVERNDYRNLRCQRAAERRIIMQRPYFLSTFPSAHLLLQALLVGSAFFNHGGPRLT